METLKQIWKNEYLQTAIMIIFIVAVVFGLWYGSKLALHTEYPALAVASGSMCMLPGPECDGWSHPFEHTLHVGDLIIIQGVDPKDINAAPYPYGDIIVFRSRSATGELIVHRAIAKQTTDGIIMFTTKGDGNTYPDQPISQESVIGKVVLRIPWVGHLALFMHESVGIFVILIIGVILVIIEFVIPAVTKEEGETEPQGNVERTSET